MQLHITDIGPTRPRIAAKDFGALDVLSLRWAPQIILMLSRGRPHLNFNLMLKGIEGISDRVLTQRLRDLETAALVKRDVEVGPPIRVFYSLTRYAEPMVAPLRELASL